MQVDNEGIEDGIVHGSFHRRPLTFGERCIGKIVFYLLLAFGSHFAINFFRHPVELGAVEHGKALFGDGSERRATGFYPDFIFGFKRSVAAAGNHEPAVGAVFTRNID